MTFRAGIEEAIKREVPEIVSVEEIKDLWCGLEFFLEAKHVNAK
jgi:Fe-S cluster biogenesis protein NfuA